MLILTGPRKNLQLTQSSEDWKQFLADPVKHWKDGRSAKMLAESWESGLPGVPKEMSDVFRGTPFESFGFVVNDGSTDSEEALVTINVFPAVPPRVTAISIEPGKL